MHGAPTFDLQAHSTYSDGTLGPADVVAHAAAADVALFALTDHDTVDGVDEALAAAREQRIRLSPAVEMSSVYREHEDLHVLGYEIDHRDSTLLDALREFRDDRVRRIEQMADGLRELGFVVGTDEIAARRREDKAIGRPHLASAVLDDPANAELLAEKGVTGMDSFFRAFLVPGGLAYQPRERPTVEEAIDLIHLVGGVAVWAHPFWEISNPNATLTALRGFREAGLDGVEVFYPSHSAEQTRILHAACMELDMLTTGSSDFHGLQPERMNRFRAFDLCGLKPRLGPIGD